MASEANLRPLTLGEILDRTIQIYRQHFLLLIGISTLPAAVDILVTGGASLVLSSRLTGFVPAAPASHPAAAPDLTATLTIFAILAAFFLIGFPILLAVFSLALGALNFAALKVAAKTPAGFQNESETEALAVALSESLTESLTVRSAYAHAFKHFWRNVGILFLQFLFAAVIPGFILGGIFFVVGIVGAIVLPKAASPIAAIGFGLLAFAMMIVLLGICIWIWIRFSLAFPASISESKNVWPSMQRSGQLSKGSRLRIFVMYLMVGILTLVVFYALLIPIDMAMGLRMDKLFDVTHTSGMVPMLIQIVNLFMSFLERAFVMPIYAIALVLFYLDQRTRHEGYDIELLMQAAQLEPGTAPANAPSPLEAPATNPNPPNLPDPATAGPAT
jgi:hypothetical protein